MSERFKPKQFDSYEKVPDDQKPDFKEDGDSFVYEEALSKGDAETEAEKTQKIIESGKAKDYATANKLIEAKDSEQKACFVSIENLIPDIKPIDPEEEKRINTMQNYHTYRDYFNTNLENDIKYALEGYDKSFSIENMINYSLVKNGFNNQIVIDIGAGDGTTGYCCAITGKARGYVGVDRFYDESINLSSYIEKTEKYKDKQPIPASWVKEDMLLFLKRLPDNSVSIISCGQADLFENKYKTEINKEIKRVLSRDGIFVNREGVGTWEGIEGMGGFCNDERIYKSDLFNIYKKFDLENEEEINLIYKNIIEDPSYSHNGKSFSEQDDLKLLLASYFIIRIHDIRNKKLDKMIFDFIKDKIGDLIKNSNPEDLKEILTDLGNHTFWSMVNINVNGEDEFILNLIREKIKNSPK